MDMKGLALSDLGYLAPELTLVIAAIVLSLLDLFLPKKATRSVLGWLSLASILVSAVFVLQQLGVRLDLLHFAFSHVPADPVELLHHSYRIDAFAGLLKLVFLGATGLIVLMSLGSVREEDIPHIGELYYLFLPATLGAMFMVSSGDFITLYVGLELLSITSYILVAMRKKHPQSNEGAFKYIVLGGISSATILYGFSFLYGVTGSTNLSEIAMALSQNAADFGAILYVALFLLLAGFGFKIAAAPFHTWAPDVYQGAPTPVTAYLAVVSKGAGLALLFRLMYIVFMNVKISPEMPISQDAFLALSVMAAAAMIVGNFTALRQRNMKRLLAYSGIANSGYLLVPIAAQFSLVHYTNFSEFLYYLIAYAFMNIGAFAVLSMVERQSGHTEMKAFAGLYYRAPWTAFAMVLLVLSLAGFPVTGGFFGKIFIMIGTLQNNLYWLAAVMIVTSVISFYYYFSIIRQMFMRGDGDSAGLAAAWPLRLTVWICALAGVAMAVYPQGILRSIQDIFSLGKDLFIS